jgi:hypothetical protein
MPSSSKRRSTTAVYRYDGLYFATSHGNGKNGVKIYCLCRARHRFWTIDLEPNWRWQTHHVQHQEFLIYQFSPVFLPTAWPCEIHERFYRNYHLRAWRFFYCFSWFVRAVSSSCRSAFLQLHYVSLESFLIRCSLVSVNVTWQWWSWPTCCCQLWKFV